jgi:hypothetical protein
MSNKKHTILLNYHLCASECTDVDVCNQIHVQMYACVCTYVCMFVLACV